MVLVGILGRRSLPLLLFGVLSLTLQPLPGRAIEVIWGKRGIMPWFAHQQALMRAERDSSAPAPTAAAAAGTANGAAARGASLLEDDVSEAASSSSTPEEDPDGDEEDDDDSDDEDEALLSSTMYTGGATIRDAGSRPTTSFAKTTSSSAIVSEETMRTPLPDVGWEDEDEDEDEGDSSRSQELTLAPLPDEGFTSRRPDDKDCIYSEWTQWSQCTKTCGTGFQNRTREILQLPSGTGSPCLNGTLESGACNINVCDIPCRYSQWSEWSASCPSCGEGNRTRLRSVEVEAEGSLECDQDSLVDIDICPFLKECPIDCEWEQWSDWSSCDKTCGEGNTNRVRSHTVARFGGDECSGPAREDHYCVMLEKCPTVCEWSPWHATECSATCGGGTFVRTRSPAVVAEDDPNCVAQAVEEECAMEPCPIDCKYGLWTDWGSCFPSCGPKDSRTKNRTRSIITHAEYHGQVCKESETVEMQLCPENPCPIDCAYNEWGKWTDCSTKCGKGVKRRSRTHIAPEHNGHVCDRPDVQEEECYGTSAKGCVFELEKDHPPPGWPARKWAEDEEEGDEHGKRQADVLGSFMFRAKSSQDFELPYRCFAPERTDCVVKIAIAEAVGKIAHVHAHKVAVVLESHPNAPPAQPSLVQQSAIMATVAHAELDEERTEIELMARFELRHPPHLSYEDLWETNTETMRKEINERFIAHISHLTCEEVYDWQFRQLTRGESIDILHPATPSPSTHRPTMPPPPSPPKTTASLSTAKPTLRPSTTTMSPPPTTATKSTTEAITTTEQPTSSMAPTTATLETDTTTPQPSSTKTETSTAAEVDSTTPPETLLGDVASVISHVEHDVASIFGFASSSNSTTSPHSSTETSTGEKLGESEEVDFGGGGQPLNGYGQDEVQAKPPG